MIRRSPIAGAVVVLGAASLVLAACGGSSSSGESSSAAPASSSAAPSSSSAEPAPSTDCKNTQLKIGTLLPATGSLAEHRLARGHPGASEEGDEGRIAARGDPPGGLLRKVEAPQEAPPGRGRGTGHQVDAGHPLRQRDLRGALQQGSHPAALPGLDPGHQEGAQGRAAAPVAPEGVAPLPGHGIRAGGLLVVAQRAAKAARSIEGEQALPAGPAEAGLGGGIQGSEASPAPAGEAGATPGKEFGQG